MALTMVFGALAAPASDASSSNGGAALALLVLIAAIAAWIGLRSLVRSLRARKTERAVGADFTQYALEALVNAAKIDGRVSDAEKHAVVNAMRELAGEAFEAIRVEASFASARLSKDELVAYLSARVRNFTRDQKTALLRGLLSVFVSDGRFDETEHAALVDYTEAIGFDRQSAPDMLRKLSRNLVRGNIT